VKRSASLVILISAAVVLSGCRREQRMLRQAPQATIRAGNAVRLSDIQPGRLTPDIQVRNIAEEKAFDLNEGKRLFTWYNCSGCHANGGGGMGPPLIDSEWIYGSDPENIRATIIEGRPNGMPAFAGKIPDYQLWQLAAYVRSISGLAPKIAAPNRSDHMQTHVPETMKKEEEKLPTETSTGGPSE
jgi:cytochrome c oxidase cbb3-type subunit III